jgi:phosphohistidine phosphatase
MSFTASGSRNLHRAGSRVDIYLIRHAEAVERGILADFDRPLTDAGRTQAERLAKALPVREAYVQRLFVSPLVRAKQTAEPLIAGWGLVGDAVLECEALAPGSRPRKLARWIGLHPAPSIGLVGHRPDLNEFAGWLIGSRKAQIAMEKAGVALVRVKGEEPEKGSGELVWLMPYAWI